MIEIINEEEMAKELAIKRVLQEYRSSVAQKLHKEGLTNFSINIIPPKDPIEQCSIMIHDNITGSNFEIIVVRGQKDIDGLMPQVIKKITELRRLT